MSLKKLRIGLFLGLMFVFFGKVAHAVSDPGKPVPPFHIAGNLYYVGNSYVGNYLIVTPKGNILINSDYPDDVAMIKHNIEKLGFKFKDTKILLISHAHIDHDGGSAQIKKETGATYMVMAPDVSAVESGGKTDLQYGKLTLYPPTKVDRVLHDGDHVTLGNSTLVAHLTPGHTKGCTTWTMQVTEKGKTYNVVIVGAAFKASEANVLDNPAYPTMAQDYEKTWHILKTLPCDIFLGAHGAFFNLDEKYARMQKGEQNVFVDPQGYKKFINQHEHDFYVELKKERTAKTG